MIREAMQYIEELVTNAAKKDEIKIGNDTYTEKNLKLIRPHVNRCETLSVNNLSMLIANVKNELGDQHILPLLLNVEEQSVYVYTSYDVNKERQRPFMAFAQSPDIRFNQYISVEAMIIQLQTCFVQDDAGNKDKLIAMISKLSKDTSIEIGDDGITQTVVASEGVNLKGLVTLPPLINLIPIRTFYEVSQPLEKFLLRINKNGEVALFDADGGAWKYQCQQSIIKYLSKELEEEIKSGKVIVG